MRHGRLARRQVSNRLWARRTRLNVEALEDRSLPSVSMPVNIASPYGGGYADSRILVQFKAEYVNQVTSLSGTQLGQAFALLPGLFEVQLSPGVSVEQALASYKADDRVLFAQPDYQIQISQTPNDPSFGSLWGLHNTGQSGGTADADIDAPEAWDVTTGSSSVIVGVIDTGVDYNHPDLAGNMWHNAADPLDGVDNDGNGLVDDYYGANFVSNTGNPLDDNNHGTHVSGTIGAVGNNGVGVVGVAWNVRIMALKFLNSSGSGYTSDAIDCINYGVSHGTKILNNSWGGGGYDAALFNAIVAAKNSGVIFVAAAGNAGSNNDTTASYPANYNVDNVVSVAAIDRNNNLASFSNYGATTVDLGAPGVSIYSTTPNNTYSTFSGTSMATPHVSGALALVWANNPTLTYKQIIDKILNNTDPISSLTGKTVTGGRLNVFKAIGNPPADTTGARVTSSVWSGSGNNVNKVQFTFSEAMAAGSFVAGDVVTFTGPGGTNLLSQITSVTGSGTTWTVNFNTQSTAGTYSMTIGPDIRDLAAPANQMDQNSNGLNGEIPGDRYTSTFALDSTYTYTSTDAPKAINDKLTTVSTLTVGDNITIKDINVRFYITHTWDADLRIRLRSPGGILLTLVQYRGGSGDNFGTSATYTTMDDEASTAITSGTAPFIGSYRPEVNNQLSKLDTKSAKGIWRLEVYDNVNLDTGTLQGWQIVVTANNGGAGGRSVSDGAGKGVNPFALLIERERAPSFVSTTLSSAERPADDTAAALPASAQVHTINRVFSEPAATLTRRQRHASAGDALASLFEGCTDLLPI